VEQRWTRAAAVALVALALAGCTAPAAQDASGTRDTAAREESRDRVRELVATLTGPQADAFAFARVATAAATEGVELIGIESYEAEEAGGAFGSLSFRTPVDPASFPDIDDLPPAFCFQVPFSEAGPVGGGDDDQGGIEDIECPSDAVVVTPPPVEG